MESVATVTIEGLDHVEDVDQARTDAHHLVDTEVLKALIVSAGEAQAQKTAAEKIYAKQRQRVEALLRKLHGPNVRVVAGAFAAEIKDVRQTGTSVEALQAHTDPADFVRCVSVSIEKVKALLGEETATAHGILIPGTAQQLRIEKSGE